MEGHENHVFGGLYWAKLLIYWIQCYLILVFQWKLGLLTNDNDKLVKLTCQLSNINVGQHWISN